MIYLYAGLGVAMLTGIMAIFEMGLSITGVSLLSSRHDPYLTQVELGLDHGEKESLRNRRKAEDQRWLSALSDFDLDDPIKRNGVLCEALEDLYTKRFLTVGEVYPWTIDARMPVKKGVWSGSCIINQGSHHVVVRPASSYGSLKSYHFYSCVLNSGSAQCSFELEEASS